MRSPYRLLTSVLLISFLFAANAFSQGAQTGGLTGVITDPAGAVVPNATVEVINENTGKTERTVNTDADGTYSITLLPPGTYRLEIRAANFKQAHVAGVQARINETARQDVRLEVGNVQEKVDIEATPTLINPTSAVTGQAVDSATMERLPLASPNVLFLLSLSTGTAGEPTDVRSNGRGSADINVNGGRTSNNSITLEGINVNDFNLAHFDTVPLPNPDVLQEFKVATSLYDASQGSKGGGALGLVVKSGSKDFHYDLYWDHRNDALNANEWFRNTLPSLKGKRARLLQNVFGGTASGPVPKLGGFWFFNYQGVRARNGIDPNGSSLAPVIQHFTTNPDGTTSAALLASDFGLTPAQIDPIAVNILNLRSTLYGGPFLIPRLGQTGCGNAASLSGKTATNPGTFSCQFSGVGSFTDNQHTISYDRVMRDGKDKFSGRWFWDNGTIFKPYGTASSLAFPRMDLQNNRFISINETHVFSATKVNELRAGYSRFISANSPTDSIALSDIGATRPNSGQFPGIYQFSITGLFSLGTGVNDERGTISNQYNVANTFSWTLSKHTLRMGGEGIQYQLNRFNNFAVRGAITFGATSGGSNAFAPIQNFLQGRITAIQSAFGDPARNFVATDFAGFIQDDYRITNRLTLNIGLRWEGMSFGHDKLFRAGIYDPALAAQGKNPFLIPEKVDLAGFRGTPGVKDCALQSCFDGNNWAPRVGFAWDMFGDQKTVVRGGYGIYYQRLSNQNILQNSLSAPFTVQPLSNNATPSSFQLANPFTSQPAPSIIATAFIPQNSHFVGLTGSGDPNDPAAVPIFVNDDGQRCLNYPDPRAGATNCSINLASFTTAPRNAYTPYTQQYNLSIQREIGKGWAFEAGYVGTHYVGGIGIWDPYLAPLASPSNPIHVTDTSGKTYTITRNTVNNEELRHQILGLSRRRGSRYSSNFAQATYNSMQLTLLRRLNRGLYFQAAYTFSKNIDNVSGSQSTDELNVTRNGQGGANILNYQNNPRQNRAISDFDRPHRLVVSYAYDIPVPKMSFFQNQVFRDWTVSGIVTYQSGLPFSVTDSTSGGAYGNTGGGTATFICANAKDAYTQGSLTDRLAHYLNPACFTKAADVPFAAGSGATGYGNAPRNAWRGPFQQNWDLSVTKHFHAGEKHNFQFRTDFFNLFNHPVFRFPSTVNIGSPTTFAKITETAVPARLIQFGLKYSF